jgi:serpin B
MERNIQLTALSFLVFLCACGSGDSSDNPSGYEELPEAEPIELRLGAKVDTDNSFAIDLFKATYASSVKPNVFVSPLSVSMALNMTLNGAAGETAEEMRTALRATDYSTGQINEYSKTLMEALPKVDPSTSLTIANSIWYREGYPVKDDFLQVNRDYYNAEIKSLDFTSPDALRQINQWCAVQTNDKIKEILENIHSEAMMYLINAVYFKGIWVSKFDKEATRTEDFYPATGSPLKVDMMRQEADFNYHSDENGGYLELPYGNNAFGMLLMLPHEGKTTDDVLEKLSGDYWNDIIRSMYGAKINLRLPRFKTECKYEMREKILSDMGMILPFTDGDGMADFSGISERPLVISEVIHKTFVEVNEEGTEAAAVTSVGMLGVADVPKERLPIDYIVNKPFLFAIRENSTGIILFIGKMGEVAAEK